VKDRKLTWYCWPVQLDCPRCHDGIGGCPSCARTGIKAIPFSEVMKFGRKTHDEYFWREDLAIAPAK